LVKGEESVEVVEFVGGFGTEGIVWKRRKNYFFCWLKLFFLNFKLFAQRFFEWVGLLES
jgi:hypothetical protein